jgi:Ser/Thr protein kinase RdoA (MazF antagonist)
MADARLRGFAFVPAVYATTAGTSVVPHAGQFWDVTEWLPGRADYHEHPSQTRLEAACVALAQLHCAWEPTQSAANQAPCPAVLRRLEAVWSWQELLRSGWLPRFAVRDIDPVRPVAEMAWRILPRWVERVPQILEQFSARPCVLQQCLCDPWHDNLLFEGEQLTGIVDYGSVKLDHVSTDLARLLGSFVGDDAQGWGFGLATYRRVRPFSQQEEELAHVLDWTGIVIGVVQWLRWLYEEGRAFEDRAKVAVRLEELVQRVERWSE